MAPEDMVNLIAYLRLHNVRMYCLSGMKTSLHADAKQHFIDVHYGDDIRLLSTCSAESKVEIVSILQDVFGCEPCEVLFIDDLREVVDSMKRNGYVSLLASEVKDIRIHGLSLTEVLDD